MGMRPASRMNKGEWRPWVKSLGMFVLMFAAVVLALWVTH